MSREHPWAGALGSIWLDKSRVTRVTGWQLGVERPYGAEQLVCVLEKRLCASRGFFVIDGGGADPLLDAVRSGTPVTLQCEVGWGSFEVEVTVDPHLARQPNVAVEVFPFEVSGGIRVLQRAESAHHG